MPSFAKQSYIDGKFGESTTTVGIPDDIVITDPKLLPHSVLLLDKWKQRGEARAVWTVISGAISNTFFIVIEYRIAIYIINIKLSHPGVRNFIINFSIGNKYACTEFFRVWEWWSCIWQSLAAGMRYAGMKVIILLRLFSAYFSAVHIFKC